MAFRLPELQARLPIVDSLGRPVTSFLRFFNVDFKGAIEKQEAAQAAILLELQEVQQTQQDEIDRLNRVLAGTENFTGIQVGGQNVKPFLDKTDGSALDDPSGLATAVVETPAVAKGDVTETIIIEGTPVGLSASSGVATTVISGSVTTTNDKILVMVSLGINIAGNHATDSFDATLVMRRNGSIIGPSLGLGSSTILEIAPGANSCGIINHYTPAFLIDPTTGLQTITADVTWTGVQSGARNALSPVLILQRIRTE